MPPEIDDDIIYTTIILQCDENFSYKSNMTKHMASVHEGKKTF